MRFVLREKFTQNLELRKILLETGDQELIENTRDAHEAINQDPF